MFGLRWERDGLKRIRLTPGRFLTVPKTSLEPEWFWTENSEHPWMKKVTAWKHWGAGCPTCNHSGTSSIEKLDSEATFRVLDNFRHERTLRNKSFTHPKFWQINFVAHFPGWREVVIEYDGSYLHRDKIVIDPRISLCFIMLVFVSCTHGKQGSATCQEPCLSSSWCCKSMAADS